MRKKTEEEQKRRLAAEARAKEKKLAPLKAFLINMNLGDKLDRFVELGYDKIEVLTLLNEEERAQLFEDASILGGKKIEFTQNLEGLKPGNNGMLHQHFIPMAAGVPGQGENMRAVAEEA